MHAPSTPSSLDRARRHGSPFDSLVRDARALTNIGLGEGGTAGDNGGGGDGKKADGYARVGGWGGLRRYEVRRLAVFDHFPYTGHVECGMHLALSSEPPAHAATARSGWRQPPRRPRKPDSRPAAAAAAAAARGGGEAQGARCEEEPRRRGLLEEEAPGLEGGGAGPAKCGEDEEEEGCGVFGGLFIDAEATEPSDGAVGR